MLESGSTPWRELAGIEQRRFTDALVNPGRTRARDLLLPDRHDHAKHQLPARRMNNLPPDVIVMNLAYLLLAEKVSSLASRAVAIQFRIDVVPRRGRGEAATVFRSPSVGGRRSPRLSITCGYI